MDKAYNKCLICEYLGDGCDGPNIISMSLQRWCEWCKELKRIRKYTNSYIAEKSGVSLATIEKIMAGTVPKDIRWTTASAVNEALVGSAGQWPCTASLETGAPEVFRDLERKTVENESLRQMLERIHASYQDELDIIRKEAQEKVDYLKLENERKDKIINKLLER